MKKYNYNDLLDMMERMREEAPLLLFIPSEFYKNNTSLFYTDNRNTIREKYYHNEIKIISDYNKNNPIVYCISKKKNANIIFMGDSYEEI